MPQPFDVRTWYREAQESRNHYDSGVASRCLKNWNEAMRALETDLKNRSSLAGDLERLKKELEFVAFPELPIEEAKRIVQSRIKEFLSSDIDIKEAFSKRYTFSGYGQSEGERKPLRETILKNTEQIGGATLGSFLQAFDKAFDPETRDDTAKVKFFRQNQQIASLNKNEQLLLQRLLDVYDEFLASELLSIFDIAVLYSKEGQLSGSRRESEGQSSRGSSSLQTVAMPLLQALSKYENLGNQLVTEGRIKVKSQAEPVRPSLLYWLKYYRDELGIGQHNSVERGQFLFRSENGKKLSPEERERVNLILKSVEENFPLSIDAEHQEIIFPAFQGVLVESHNELRAKPFMTTSNSVPAQASRPEFFNTKEPKPSFENGGMRVNPGLSFSLPKGDESNQGEKKGLMSFSASHIFPAEKEVEEKKVVAEVPVSPSQAPAPRPSQARPLVEAPRSNPFSIHPVSLRKEDE